jgi:hypothetical protein
MKIGSIYSSKCVFVVWNDPGKFAMGTNEKAVVGILNKGDFFIVLDINESEIEVQRFDEFKSDIILRGVAKIMTFDGVSGWLVSYNNWIDFDCV